VDGTRVPAIEIRLMRADDWDRVVEILGHWGMAPVAPSERCPDPEPSGLEAGRTLVACDAGRIVGVASYRLTEPGSAFTESLAVDPLYVGRGVAERLQRARLDALHAQGVRRVRTTADRPRTIAWYLKRYGCRVVGTVPKRHPISLPDVPEWTLLELDLEDWNARGRR
jgi:GNAT superfamily N-acetyltransferase